MAEPDIVATYLHLVRHGEVENPDHVVYGALPGYSLSERGRRQAADAARHLAGFAVDLVVSSPLERAVETATPIAAVHGLEIVVEPLLTEWAYGERWSGHPWDAIPSLFPGELEAYLDDPSHLTFSSESLDALAERLVDAVTRHNGDTTGRSVVVVAHQDPVEAARRRLTDRTWTDFHADKPEHGTVVTLTRNGSGPWRETEVWNPPGDEQ